jgi:hypothetical protein
VADWLRDRGVDAHLLRGGGKENLIMTPQQKALVAELRAADYPAAWKLSASWSDDKLVTSAAQVETSPRRRSALLRTVP